jgi:hypothetical protein
VICGEDLSGRRRHAKTCGNNCRQAPDRIRRASLARRRAFLREVVDQRSRLRLERERLIESEAAEVDRFHCITDEGLAA